MYKRQAYIQQLQREGVVRHIGLSSHTPELAHQVLDLDVIDLLMFSINPGYDYHHGDYAIGGAEERLSLIHIWQQLFRCGAGKSRRGNGRRDRH